MRRITLGVCVLLAGMAASLVAFRLSPSSAQTTIPIGVDAYSNHISSEPAGLTYVYKYIVPGGQSIVASYINTAYANGKKPVLVIYTNYDSTAPDWATWDGAMNAIRADGRDVDVVVEPDLFGYVRNENACGTTGKQHVDRFLSTAPSNAHLGFFISPWMLPYTTPAADAAAWKACWQAAGGDRMEDIYVDVTDRDQEYKGTYPWPASKVQMYEDWFKALQQATGRKIGVWQIPLGNSQCQNGRRSTFVESWLVESKLLELSPYVDKLLFGPGIEDYDSANTQSWNLPQHVKYDCGMFNTRVTSLSNGSGGTPLPTATRTVGPTATRTSTPTATAVPGADTDHDGVPDATDNCLSVSNANQANTDKKPIDNGPVLTGDDITVVNSDGLGDACDSNDDNDWMFDTATNTPLGIPGENAGCGSGATNSKLMDSDGDMIVDGAECLLGSNPNDAGSRPPAAPPNDSDGDGLSNSVEALFGSNPNDVDTDGDGITDGVEVKGWGSSPTLADTNDNGCNDDVEIADINGDGRVSVSDLTAISKRAASVQDDDFDVDPPFNFSPGVDVNKDGRITVGDVTLVGRSQGERCE